MNPITFNFTGAIENYTVPVTGTYDLSAFGAAGGEARGIAGGSGAQIGGTFNLTAGQQLFIIVGADGGTSANGGGGGGFSEIYTQDTNNNITPLLVAGGGGGSGIQGGGSNATIAASGPGTGGSGGSGSYSGGGGAGATSNGGDGVGQSGGSGGFAAANGAAGGAGTGSFSSGGGGYGGGGGSAGAGGGGGGYTGGVGGTGDFPYRGGGGGTSYISNTGVQNFQETMAGNGVSTGNGSATIRFVPAAAPAPCYVTGTHIRVLRGLTIQDVPVERLRVGDLVLTASGKPRPIRWIGTRAYSGLSAPKHDRPVRIAAGALADGMPARDLLVSPDHCLSLDGLFVAAGHLSNGTSIVRGEAVRDLTYWHVELDSHDLLLAENTPAESFLAAPGVREGFDGTTVPDAAVAAVAYAPRAERHTPETNALHKRLILRAGLSTAPTRFGTVRAWLDVCDGARVAGWAQDAAYPDAPVCLDIVVDGAVVAMALTQDHRADLAAAGMGDGRHGFDIDLDEPLMPGMAHTVEVRRSADGLRVAAMAVDAAGAWTALLAA